jgi:dihydrofolate reductase
VGGAALAAEAVKAGLVDKCHLVLAPVLVGGGKHGFPDGVGLELQLLQERRFASGMVFLRYRAVSSGSKRNRVTPESNGVEPRKRIRTVSP